MATFATFLAQVRRELEEEGVTSGVWDDDSILAWTNEGADRIATETAELEDLIYPTTASVTVSGQQSYDLPDYTLAIKSVIVNETRLAKERVYEDWDPSRLTESGIPEYYGIANRALYLRPIPNAGYVMLVWRTRLPTPMTATTDTMPFESRYDHALRLYVKARAFEQEPDDGTKIGAADKFDALFRRELGRIQVQRTREREADWADAPEVVF